MKYTVTFLSLAIALGACSKKDGDGEGGGGDSATITLADLDGLKIDVQKGTEPSKLGSSVMIMSISESFTVDVASDSTPQTLDDAKKQATELYNAKDIEEVKVEGGWGITFANKGSMGENYWLNMRREINGKAYWCSTSVGHKTLRDGAVRACKTLRQ